MTKKFRQPQGVSDVLTRQCYAKNKIERQLLDCFARYGYNQIDTPVLEYGDLYSAGAGKVNMNKLFKLTDYDGSLLVLRPDMTMPISRIVSTKIPEGKYKFCYRGKMFRFSQGVGTREFSQVGIELMGASGICCDAEVVSLAIASLIEAGLEDFIIDIGHVGFFKGLLSSLRLSDEERKELAELVESKNSIGEQLFAKKTGLTREQQESILKMPMLFGGDEVFDEAEKYSVNDEMREAVKTLRKLDAILKAQGYDKYVSYDLSLVGEMSYYSGIVFKGMCEGVGSSILSGGRYDHLCDSFDRDIPSVGFAIGSDMLLLALAGAGKLPVRETRDVAVGCDEEGVAETLSFVRGLVAEGNYVVNLSVCKESDVKEYAENNGIKQAYYFRGDKPRCILKRN